MKEICTCMRGEKMMMWNSLRVVVLLVTLMYPSQAEAKRLHIEDTYNSYWCKTVMKGVYEKKIPDKIGTGYTRADCVLDDYAVEVDFANEWSGCGGQAFYYADMLGKIPGCLLILEDAVKDVRYLNRLKVFKRRGLKIWTITPNDLIIQ